MCGCRVLQLLAFPNPAARVSACVSDPNYFTRYDTYLKPGEYDTYLVFSETVKPWS